MIYLVMTFQLKSAAEIIPFSDLTDKMLDDQDAFLALDSDKDIDAVLFQSLNDDARILEVIEWPSIASHESWYKAESMQPHFLTLIGHLKEGGGFLSYTYLNSDDQNTVQPNSLNIFGIRRLELSIWTVPSKSRKEFENAVIEICNLHTSSQSLIGLSGFWTEGGDARERMKENFADLNGLRELVDNDDGEFYLWARHPPSNSGATEALEVITLALSKKLLARGLKLSYTVESFVNVSELEGW